VRGIGAVGFDLAGGSDCQPPGPVVEEAEALVDRAVVLVGKSSAVRANA